MAWWMFAASAHADMSGIQRLEDFFSEVKSLRAEFTQTVAGSQLQTPKPSQGTLQLQRPGQFRWDYRTPVKQLMIGDGEKVWMYDPDLEQVIVRPQVQTLGGSPAALLSSDRPLSEGFMLTDLGAQADGRRWIELSPKQQDTEFNIIRLGLGARDLEIMELEDGFGQTTTLIFTNLERNPKIDPATFRFTPPAGVDVIGE
jgi:outer membrane lipoprotein carrier protein